MIRLEINPTRIERVVLESKSEIERDFDDAAYRLIQPLISRIDTRLRKAATEAIEKASLRGPSFRRPGLKYP